MSPSALAQRLESLELAFAAEDEVRLVLLRPDEAFFAYSRHDLGLMEYAIGNIAEEIFRDGYEAWFCKDTHGYLVFLVKEKKSLGLEEAHASGPPRRPRMLEREASEIQSGVKAYLHGTVSVLISGRGTFPRDVPALYQASLAMIRQRFGQEGEFLISAEAFGEAPPVDGLTGLHDTPTLVQLLEAGRWEMLADKLEAVFSSIGRLDRSLSQEHIMEVVFALGSALISICHKNGKRLEDVIGEPFGALLQPSQLRHVEQLREWSARAIDLVRTDDIQGKQGETAAYFVRRAQEYVEQNLAGDTSLQAVADHVCLHPVYLSRLYKSETGEGLSGYVLRLKMEKAEKLLTEGNKKVHEIAELLGYDNPPYFIKVFKKARRMDAEGVSRTASSLKTVPHAPGAMPNTGKGAAHERTHRFERKLESNGHHAGRTACRPLRGDGAGACPYGSAQARVDQGSDVAGSGE
ncbi:helix-turn-helix transcriptional regulator [Cohnella rhizosphaerae]|uniref:Helix-turn-helix domain-containing protein n=1 Tax=Cohnella rhizosphaerae TaxID=1457232 RepID=A0A9X4KUS1_9BACL|nr:helix-turn-helix domain-containing protein [Cohnella rhizosphaerae]MDG0810646.1 helix-turn-helix domain-containing protein [Cohnella rhizosphaerae]